MPNGVKRREEFSSSAAIVDGRDEHRNRVVKSCDFERGWSLENPPAARTDELCVKVTPGIKSNQVISKTIPEATKTHEQVGLDTK